MKRPGIDYELGADDKYPTNPTSQDIVESERKNGKNTTKNINITK